MLFNSLEFFLFFILVLVVYHASDHRRQNIILLIASYIFYSYTDWRFLFLILFSTAINYIAGLEIYKSESDRRRKAVLVLCVIANLSFLGFFKYFNFFIENIASILSVFGFQPHIHVLNIILPFGISFYTFQTLSYTIDIYKREIAPTYEYVDFAVFVSYFPHLVAGPIMRAKTLLPQIRNRRSVTKDNVREGMQLIFWGLFKKIFVADNLGLMVNQTFANQSASGPEYIIASWAFAFQIYGDFSGYTDIARGTSKWLGIELALNFNQPYMAVNPSDFWRRWHISLSTWLRDYLYIPLGGNKKGEGRTYFNLMVTMLLGGLWHGAAWNFIIWGFYHGILLCIHRLTTPWSKAVSAGQSLLSIIVKAFIMFQLTCIGWIFFRSQSLDQIMIIFGKIVNVHAAWAAGPEIMEMLSKLLFFSAPVILVMFVKRTKENNISAMIFESLAARASKYGRIPLMCKTALYGVMTYYLFLYGAAAQTFIYFQF